MTNVDPDGGAGSVVRDVCTNTRTLLSSAVASLNEQQKVLFSALHFSPVQVSAPQICPDTAHLPPLVGSRVHESEPVMFGRQTMRALRVATGVFTESAFTIPHCDPAIG